MAAPLTKWSVQVERADEFAPILHRALKIANDPPAGPVFVALPIDVLEQETDLEPARPRAALPRARARSGRRRRPRQLLLGARRPGDRGRATTRRRGGRGGWRWPSSSAPPSGSRVSGTHAVLPDRPSELPAGPALRRGRHPEGARRRRCRAPGRRPVLRGGLVRARLAVPAGRRGHPGRGLARAPRAQLPACASGSLASRGPRSRALRAAVERGAGAALPRGRRRAERRAPRAQGAGRAGPARARGQALGRTRRSRCRG